MQQSRQARSLVLVLDFGSQYTQLIARRMREQNVYCEIHPYNLLAGSHPRAGPDAASSSRAGRRRLRRGRARMSPALFELGVPILGICYGVQLTAQLLGGEVAPRRQARVRPRHGAASAAGAGRACSTASRRRRARRVDDPRRSRRGAAGRLPRDRPRPTTARSPAVGDAARKFYGVQFHPEVVHTPRGGEMLGNFLFRICGCQPTGRWPASSTRRWPRSARRSGDGRA